MPACWQVVFELALRRFCSRLGTNSASQEGRDTRPIRFVESGVPFCTSHHRPPSCQQLRQRNLSRSVAVLPGGTAMICRGRTWRSLRLHQSRSCVLPSTSNSFRAVLARRNMCFGQAGRGAAMGRTSGFLSAARSSASFGSSSVSSKGRKLLRPSNRQTDHGVVTKHLPRRTNRLGSHKLLDRLPGQIGRSPNQQAIRWTHSQVDLFLGYRCVH